MGLCQAEAWIRVRTEEGFLAPLQSPHLFLRSLGPLPQALLPFSFFCLNLFEFGFCPLQLRSSKERNPILKASCGCLAGGGGGGQVSCVGIERPPLPQHLTPSHFLPQKFRPCTWNSYQVRAPAGKFQAPRFPPVSFCLHPDNSSIHCLAIICICASPTRL